MKETIDNLIAELDALRNRYTGSSHITESEFSKILYEQFENVRDAYDSLNREMMEYEN